MAPQGTNYSRGLLQVSQAAWNQNSGVPTNWEATKHKISGMPRVTLAGPNGLTGRMNKNPKNLLYTAAVGTNQWQNATGNYFARHFVSTKELSAHFF